jgi:sugar phosphate isomerase/epimerase
VTPRFSVIEFTTPHLTFAEDLVAFREAGATGIGISEDKLTDDRDDLARLASSGLAASSFFPTAGTILPSPLVPGSDEPAARIDSIAVSIRRLARFEPPCGYIATGPFGQYSPEEGWAIVVEGCRALAAVAAEEGLSLALELMHPSLSGLFSFMNSLPQAMRLIDEAGAPNLAIALDMWHLSEGEEVFDEILRFAPRFAAVHLNDRREPTRSWCDRVLPGDGVLDLERIFGALDAGGFDGWFELEVVSDDGTVEHDYPDSLWKRPPVDLIAEGKRQFLEIWDHRRPPAPAV